jgi:hypothetical protein
MHVRDARPGCGAQQFKKTGHLPHGTQNHQGKACGRQFVVHAERWAMSEEQRALEEASTAAFTQSYGVFQRAAFQQEPCHLQKVWLIACGPGFFFSLAA